MEKPARLLRVGFLCRSGEREAWSTAARLFSTANLPTHVEIEIASVGVGLME